MKSYKSIIFDLGGVVVARDPSRCTAEFIEFFDYIHYDPMPKFWSDYDRGEISFDEVKRDLAQYRGVSLDFCTEYIDRTIYMQEEVLPTKELIVALKGAGYKIYVLSNMAREYIEYIRTLDVYSYFDGEVISSEEGCVKPEAQIYKVLLDRYSIEPSEALFIDDRMANIDMSKQLGIDALLFDANNPSASCGEIYEFLKLTS